MLQFKNFSLMGKSMDSQKFDVHIANCYRHNVLMTDRCTKG